MSFEDDIKAQLEAPKDFIDVSVKLNGNTYKFRIEQMDPEDWATACAMFPARPGVTLDMRLGYNLTKLTPLVVAKTGKRFDGDELVEVSPEDWDSLFQSTNGGTLNRFSNAIFNLNEFQDEAEIEELKKAFAAVAEMNSRSRSKSASRTAASSAGNPSK